MDRSANDSKTPSPPPSGALRRMLFVAPLLAAGIGLAACGGGGGGGGGGGAPAPAPAPSPPAQIGPYVASLPNWSTFAPDLVDPSEEAKEIADPAVTPTVEDLVQGNKTLSCTTRKVSFYKTPDEYAMFSPPLDVLYPGQLVQGRSLRDGNSPSDIESLTITDRNPITVSIPACLTNDNSRTVAPTLDAVNQARASIVASAIAQNASCISAIGSLKTETYRNDVHKALKIGVSGKYYGFSAKADTSFSKSKTENGLSVTFTEQLYRVQYQAPQTPAEVFSPAFTQARLDEQIALQRIGPDNLPVYVAEVVYGRLMSFSMVSTASETEMEAAVKAAYSVAGGIASVKGQIDATYESILSQARYSTAYLGGSAEANSAMLRNLDWGDYFSKPVTAADAVPIAFTLRNLADNRIATVQELTRYDLTTCEEKLADDATFAFSGGQTLTPAFGAPGSVLVKMADVDGRNGADIVLATTGSGGRGEIRVALSNGDGTFATPIATRHPGAVLQTGDFQLEVGDVDKDGRADIILNARDNAVGNRVYVTFYKDGGGFVHSATQDLGGPGAWSNYPMRVAQMDGKHGIDLVWNNVPASTTFNTTYLAHAVAKAPGDDLSNGPLFVRVGGLNHPIQNFSAYEFTHIADFDGDGRADIVWQNLDGSAGNMYYIARGTPTGLDFGAAPTARFRDFGSQWGAYTALAGDVTGGGKTDFVQPRRLCPFNEGDVNTVCTFGIFVFQGSGSPARAYTDGVAFQGRDAAKDLTIADLLGRTTVAVAPDFLLADVDGNGIKDLLINDKGRASSLVNRIGVGLGNSTGQFSFARIAQDVGTARDWSTHQAIVADVNGDTRDDVVWISPGSSTSVYVGLARGN